MVKRTVWLLVTCLAVVSILIVSCGNADIQEEEAPPTSESISSEGDEETTEQESVQQDTGETTPEETESRGEPGKEVSGADKQDQPTAISPDFDSTLPNHFGFMPAFVDYAAGIEAGGRWTRPNFERFNWGMVEPEPGVFFFGETDRRMQEAQQYGYHILANLQPKAIWDEQQCYEGIENPAPGMPPRFDGAHLPCDMEAYKNFVSSLVERYDGDGLNDMPGLTFPIKHWEIMNEPEFEFYFLGTPEEYVEIVKTSVEAIREADPEAVIVQGGMAGMMEQMTEFWQQVFDLGAADYFDVMNMHSIGHGEHLNIPAFKRMLEDNGITGKPVWVTEVQYQQARETEDFTPEQYAETMARSYIFALANGVDKLFYVNLRMPKFDKGGPPFDERSALIDDSGMKTPVYFTHRTIADKLGELSRDDEIEIIREKVSGWFIEEGQYKFTAGGKVIYALWGNSAIPAEIQGEVTVTYISGESETVGVGAIRLTDTPIFVEMP